MYTSSFVCLYALFQRVQKKKQEKGTPTVLSACGGYLALLVVGGALKTHPPLAGSDRSSVYSANICDAQLDRMGPQKTNNNLILLSQYPRAIN
jgi:hypothetical protein